ncbi:MAG: TIGR03862 family flavoprotein [Rhodobacteraceae bacterium]|nr:MAG: TIGR03862 family flavoprotein [Paracoccaceae bacterium]
MKDEADKCDALVVGAGPAGLAAAERLASAGAKVLVADAMPSVGRKFLMAGKSGLNLTKDEPVDAFLARFAGGPASFTDAVRGFGPADVLEWAEGLGQPVFAGTTGRVFPKAMKASPLLRAWLGRLDRMGVRVATRMRWTGWDGNDWLFETPGGPRRVSPDVAILALGGASWRRLGSDGAWVDILRQHGISLAPFRPSNGGLRVEWSRHMATHFGAPVKATRLIADGTESRGEWVVSSAGMEGGGVYEVSMAVRDGSSLHVDLTPDLSEADIVRRLDRRPAKESLSNRLRKALGLSPVARALVMEWGQPLPKGALLAERIKRLPVPVAGVMPMDQAISTAGGVDWGALDGYMLRTRPGTFVAGEMLDWEAPTGGYLITGCLATGRAAGDAAAMWLAASRRG